MSNILPYLYIVLLVIASAFFSSSEMAITSANRRRLRRSAEKGILSQRLAFSVYEDYDKTLSMILIWNNLVNNAASSLMTVIALSLFKNNATLFATLIMTIILLIFGEIIPKIIAKNDADAYLTKFSILVKLMIVISTPLVWVSVNTVKLFAKLFIKRTNEEQVSVTEDELVSIIETIEDEGVIDESHSNLLQSAVEFADTIAKEILTPRVDMIAIDIDDDLKDILDELMDCPYSRIPVYQDTIDNIIGILYINEFLSLYVNDDSIDIRQMLVEPFFINETMKLPDILMSLRRKHMHLAIVLDEYGGTSGMITMEDILEQIVGDIWDETDEIIDDIIQTDSDVFEVNGEMYLDEFIDHFDLDENQLDSEYMTIGGYVSELLEDIPELNDEVIIQDLLVRVIELDDIRASRLLVIKQEEKEEIL
ncbi:MAG: hemolysin family protein [Erysipelotrichaceae bacterium]|nr:hemolysin family protein [Erysipelotrichaceae bacterium]MDD3924189.1 hemolysin family protein [Erysipelotrichaceae bacterium]MDD4643292.1 hemolysin family protein [Erysipelotrichaceae bacterium]